MLLQLLHRAPELGLLSFLKALPFVLPEAFPITLPMSFLIACLLTYGRFADDNEFTAFRMGGVHPWHAIAPAVAMGAVMSLLTLWTTTDVMPWAQLGKKEIVRDKVEQLARALEGGSSTTVSPNDGFRLSAASRAPDGAFVDVHISIAPRTGEGGDGGAFGELAQGGEIEADRAWLWYDEAADALVIRLQNALWQRDDITVHVEQNTVSVALDALLSASPRESQKSSGQMNADELTYRIERASADADEAPPGQRSENVQSERSKEILSWRAELWRRIALGLAPLVFGILGAPLGLWSARGSRASAFLLALVVALPVYYPLLRVGENLANAGTLPAPLALLLADIALAGTGLVFLVRVVRA